MVLESRSVMWMEMDGATFICAAWRTGTDSIETWAAGNSRISLIWQALVAQINTRRERCSLMWMGMAASIYWSTVWELELASFLTTGKDIFTRLQKAAWLASTARRPWR